ncbi:hypothetical protein CEXT_488031 [Caerostris extrusa]|uniref:Uncharacterized protein n=1 Tax=Caerostris extrusa TaxID=172846 RepID=A0AAV4PU20_CAEEX|nr:hypothetical protein CEXT_488031 [Caerostris extrusa]
MCLSLEKRADDLFCERLSVAPSNRVCLEPIFLKGGNHPLLQNLPRVRPEPSALILLICLREVSSVNFSIGYIQVPAFQWLSYIVNQQADFVLKKSFHDDA